VTWRFPLHPSIACELGPDAVKFTSGDDVRWLLLVDSPPQLAASLTDGWWSPSYGVKLPTRVLVFDGELDLPQTFIGLFSTTWLSSSARRNHAEALALFS
jgi:hypothetical protein